MSTIISEDENWSSSATDQDKLTVDELVDPACLDLEFGIEKKISLQQGLDFLATIACRIATTTSHTEQIVGEPATDYVEETYSDEYDDKTEGYQKFNGGKPMDHNVFLPPPGHEWIIDPLPGTVKEFLDDSVVDPREKRVHLALHTAYCDEMKHEGMQRHRREMEISRRFQNLQIQREIQKQNERIESNLKRKRKTSDNKEKTKDGGLMIKEVPLYVIYEPQILRLSIYEKFVRQFLFYYNAHDTAGVVDQTLIPYCSKDIVRQNCLWAPRHVVNPLTGRMEERVVVVEDKSYFGHQSFKIAFNLIFQKLPDGVMIYHNSKIQYDVNTGITRVYTPFTAYCTVFIAEDDIMFQQKGTARVERGEALKLPVDEDIGDSKKCKLESRRMIQLEATGWNVVHFNSEHQIIFRRDNFFYKIIGGVTESDPPISAETVWHAIWK